MKQSALQEVAQRLCSTFRGASTNGIARMIQKELPGHNFNSARMAVRYYRGELKMKPQSVSAPGRLGTKRKGEKPNGFRPLPEPKKHFDEWGAVQFDGPLRCLVLSDLHLPYYDRKAVELSMQRGAERKANMVLLNGDIADFFTVSWWQRDPRKRDFPGEVSSVKQFLGHLRDRFPKARIVYKLGNHEDRYQRYMESRAPELLDVPDFELGSLLGLKQVDMQLIGDNRPVRLGKLNVIHGHEYRFAISNPVNPARGYFLRARVHVLGGHFHQHSQHSAKNLEGNVVTTWSTGCLCDMHPDYRPLNDWSQGFAFVEVGKDGSFSVDNYRVVNGKVW